MGFKRLIKEYLKDKLTEMELNQLPRGFQTLGKIIILRLNPKLFEKKKLIAEAYLELLPHIRSIYLNKGKIEGKFRTPRSIEFLAGENNPIVEHKEHDIKYKFNITKIMFSQGNLNERRFLATLVEDGEIIVDMFAGIGYFSLPIAKHANPERIYSIELNPTAYNFFVENIQLNELEKKINPILGDCKEIVVQLSEKGIRANRVIMGVFPAPKNYIKEALTLTKEEGTIFHYEGVVKKENYLSLYNEFKEIAEKERYSCSLESKRFVKGYGPHLKHVVLDILVLRN